MNMSNIGIAQNGANYYPAQGSNYYPAQRRPSDDASSTSAMGSATITALGIRPMGSKSIVVPERLDLLSKTDLITLVQDLDNERRGRKLAAIDMSNLTDTLTDTTTIVEPLSKKRKKSMTSIAEAEAGLVPLKPSEKQVNDACTRMGMNAARVIKKTAHGNRKKPVSEVSEGGMSWEMVTEIMKEYARYQKSDTKKLARWVVTSDTDVSKILRTGKLIHPVKFDGKVISFGGRKPKVYCWASFEHMEVKYDKAQQNLVLKIKTAEAGCGNPDTVGGPLLAYSEGTIGAIPRMFY